MIVIEWFWMTGEFAWPLSYLSLPSSYLYVNRLASSLRAFFLADASGGSQEECIEG